MPPGLGISFGAIMDDTADPFTCSVQRADDTVTLELHGELDMASTERFEQSAAEVVEAQRGHVVIDLRGLRFIDSSGIRGVLRVQSLLPETARLELIPGPPAVQRVFELTGLIAALPFRATS
jgi:anti-sigma B factor antagonist